MSAAALSGDRLLREKEELAQAITERLHRDRPELTARHGEAGRLKCLQDMRYNLEHLAPAVALGEPSLFAGYARWLASLLSARGIPLDEVVHSLVLTRATIAERFPAEEAAATAAALEAGLAALAAPPAA